MDNPSPSAARQLFGADDLQRSITDLLARLVRIPSRAGVDPCDKIFAFVADWLRDHDVPCRALLGREGRLVAITGQIGDAAERGVYVLNATVDTVGFGDLAAWTRDPTGSEIADGWLYGRGSADSKAGMAIFCQLLAVFRSRSFVPALGFVFDADEHTGHFSGIRSYLEQLDGRIAGMLIGYPGMTGSASARVASGARSYKSPAPRRIRAPRRTVAPMRSQKLSASPAGSPSCRRVCRRRPPRAFPSRRGSRWSASAAVANSPSSLTVAKSISTCA
jgi:acetylornithine deacetylase/succinyl-diaminopimelate desuccinylase-like protein